MLGGRQVKWAKHRTRPPNNRMQLTWLPGAPSQPVSVHWRVVGRVGLGSPATQLMRAVRPLHSRKHAYGLL
jgi:hypothetical protein